MTKHLYDFTEGDKDQKDLLGGKGANLAEMTRLGLPVPPGEVFADGLDKAKSAKGVSSDLDLDVDDLKDLVRTFKDDIREHSGVWMLQTRVGKRTPAAFRITAQLVDENLITMAEALSPPGVSPATTWKRRCSRRTWRRPRIRPLLSPDRPRLRLLLAFRVPIARLEAGRAAVS